MNEEKELFLPDTTVKLGTLRRVLNDIYGLDIIKLKMTQTDIMHFEGLHLYETDNGYGIDNRGLVYEYKPKDKASLQQATKHFTRVKQLIMSSRYAKGSTIRASNSPVLEFVNFEDNWHINLLKLNPNRNQNGLLYKGGNKYAVIRSGNKDKQELFEFKTLEEAEDKFDKLVTESTTYSPIRNQGKIEGNYANGGGVGGTFDSSSTGEVIGGTYGSSESGEMIGGTMASSMYAKGGGVGEEFSVWKLSKSGVVKLKTGTMTALNRFLNKEKSLQNKGLASIFDGKSGVVTFPSNVTQNEVIKYNNSMGNGSATSQEYANGGGVGDEISIATKYGKMLNEISKEKQFNKKIELNSQLNQFAKQNEISIDHNNIIYIKGNKVAYIDTLNSKTGQSKINWVIKKYANGGGVGAIIEVVGKGDRGAFRKREYEGMTEKEVSDWWESRGYKPSKNKSESKLKPYTFYINKYANGGGIGGTSDSAEMDAPTLGGTMSSSMFEGDTYSNRFENKLWNEMANGTPHSFKNGGAISQGKKYGDWILTQYTPLSYDDLGGLHGGMIKLVNQNTFDEIIIWNDKALRSPKWSISYNKSRIEDKNPSIVIEKVLKSYANNPKLAKGGNCGCKEKYDEGGNAECGCWHYDIGGL